MEIEKVNLKLKSMIFDTYENDDDSSISMLKNYLLFLINNKISDEIKIEIVKNYMSFNQFYVKEIIVDFLSSSLLNIIKNKLPNNNQYFLFRYLSKKEIYKRILNINLKNSEIIFDNVPSNILINIKNTNMLFVIDDYFKAYEDFFNKKIKINKNKNLLFTFLNIKKDIINNDEHLISLVNNDNFLLVNDNKIIIKNNLKNILKLLFSLELINSEIDFNESTIKSDIENNLIILGN